MEGITASYIITFIKCFAAVVVGILAGNGAVYFFNRMPAEWLCDYGEKPGEELTDPYTQRIKSMPWKYTFSMLFVVLGIKLVIDDWQFAIGAIIAIWLLLVISIGDIKYRIIPDQLIILLVAAGFSFAPYHGSWKPPAIGAVIGFGIVATIALIAKLTYKRETIGGGDLKLYTALGFVTGPRGIIFIFVVSTLLSALHFALLLATKRAKPHDSRPLAPYIAIAAAAYLVFFWGEVGFLNI